MDNTNKWGRYALIAAIAAAGFSGIKISHRNSGNDFRDAVADKTAVEGLKDVSGDVKFAGEFSEPKAGRADIPAAGEDSAAGAKPVEWITIPGGGFTMGTDSGAQGLENAKPAHKVEIKTFQMSKTAVTVAQYEECVDQKKCAAPDIGEYCNWGKDGRRLHPVNCVSWDQADQYAKFKSKQPGFEGARLPSESEWEYAARSGGRDREYPWAGNSASCEKAVMYGKGGPGCGENGTWPVCLKPGGNTEQGLCDMAGNVFQWVQDKYQDSYIDAPVNGDAVKGEGPRVTRGGSFFTNAAGLRAVSRRGAAPGRRGDRFGFRLAR